MKILIAGGAGYIGSVLIPQLLERGHQVDVVELFWFGNRLPADVGILHKDIFDLTVEDLQGYEQVLFLAGLSNDPMAEFSPAKNFIFNAAAPAFLAYMAKQAGAQRYVYACSCSVYGFTVNELYDESRPAISAYPYGISKLQGEQAALQLQDENFSVISLRKGTVCGYSPRMRLDLIINTMFKTGMRDAVITVNNPTIWRPIVSIRDAAAAYTRAIEVGYEISGVFNIASGNYTVGDVAEQVKESIHAHTGSHVTIQHKSVQDFRNYKVTSQKAIEVLGFRPKDDVRSIVDELFRHRHEFSDWDCPNYYNIQRFKQLESDLTLSSRSMSAVGSR